MKKIISLLLCVSLLGLTACSNQVVHTADMDEVKPWDTVTKYERCEYKVERYRMKRSGKATVTDGDPIAVGSYVTTVKINDDSTRVTNQFTLTYAEDDRAGASQGLTDTTESDCEFASTGGFPTYSYRKTTLAPRAGEQRNNSYEIFANYRTTPFEVHGRSIDANVTKMLWHDTESSLSIQTEGQVFDNEQLYYMLRAFKNIRTEGSERFSLSTLFDAHNNGAFSTHSMSLSIDKAAEVLDLDESFTRFSTQTQNDRGETIESIASDGQGHAKLRCLKGTLSVSSTNPGPAFIIYFSDVPFRINEHNSTKKVIARIVTKEFTAAEETYNMIYTLTGYTTDPNA